MYNYAALAKHMQHWRKICSIGETYAALAKHMQHLRKICSIGQTYAALAHKYVFYRWDRRLVKGEA